MNQVYDFGFIFWVLLFFLFLYPQWRHKMLQQARLSTIRKIEKQRNSRVIVMIHRQERIGLFGIPFYKYIDVEDSEQVLRAIRMTPSNMPIMIVLHTPGGLVLASAQIALALKAHPAKTCVVVPHFAMSGGTLIALAADEIIMDSHAVLGPVDPQLADQRMGTIPAASVVKAVQEKGKDKASDQTLILADVAEKAIKQLEDLVFQLTKDKLGEEKARKLARELALGKYTHDYPLTPDKLEELGIKVNTEVPKEIYDLMELYPQPLQARPSVEFIPTPYAPPQPKGKGS